jgi:hypothetical protein
MLHEHHACCETGPTVEPGTGSRCPVIVIGPILGGMGAACRLATAAPPGRGRTQLAVMGEGLRPQASITGLAIAAEVETGDRPI